MFCGQIDFPDKLVQAIKEGQLVVFAGAGVSMGAPACLPSFWKLAENLAEGTGRVPDEKEPLDRFLGELCHQGTKIHARAAAFLTGNGLEPNSLHKNLLRLFPGVKAIRVVTTNFDLLFENASRQVWNEEPDIYRAPALPLGRRFFGIAHIHGSVAAPSDMVLTDIDFGRAYLTEGWARRFLVDLFSTYTVLFVGYSHEDVVMNYLARALPPNTGSRFVLDSDDADGAAWARRGIELITFPKPGGSHDYSCLDEGVRKLANIERRGILELQQDIETLACQAPPPDQPSSRESTDFLKHALRDGAKARFFVKKARHPAWLEWLDRHKLLDPLFQNMELAEATATLSRWITEHYILPHPKECLTLFGAHRLNLNTHLWCDIARGIALSEETVAADVFEKYVSLLLDTAPRHIHFHFFHWLAERSHSLGCHKSSLAIFAYPLVGRLSIRPSFLFSGEGKSEPRAEISISDDRRGLALRDIWQSAVKPNLHELAAEVISRLVPVLQQRHATNAAWQPSTRQWDADSRGRSAIEPHEQDEYPESIDIIIDAVRDSLEVLMSTDDEQFLAWMRILLRSDVPLLRRIGVHSLRLDSRTPPSEKIELLIQKGLLLEINLHHEVFTLLKDHYSSASESTRNKLVQAIQSFTWPCEDDDKARFEAREKYSWLSWIAKSDPNCAVAKPAIAEILDKFPDFGAMSLEHVDFTHWSGKAEWGRGTNPWTVDRLLQRKPEDSLTELLGFNENAFTGPDGYDFQQVIADASKQNAKWGLGLASALGAGNHWKTDVWKGLLRAWQEWPGDVEIAKTVMQWLRRRELFTAHAASVVDVLLGLCKEEPRSYAKDLLAEANEIAREIWPLLNEVDSEFANNDWLLASINHPAGVLAQFWLKSLSLAFEPMTGPNQVPTESLSDLDALLDGTTNASGCARTIFASQFTYLNYLNEKWANDRLLPLFNSDEPIRYKQAWDGFVGWGTLTPKIVELLKTALFAGTKRLTAKVVSDRRRFVHIYVAAMWTRDEDIFTDWIPQFFANATQDDRETYAVQIYGVLRTLNEQEQREVWEAWLEQYWNNRIDGIPVPLSDGETNHMLDWLAEISELFPNAVRLAIRMPKPRLEHSLLLFRLGQKECTIARTFPTEVAQLLIYLLDCPNDTIFSHTVGGVLAVIDATHIDPCVKISLIEKLVEKGFDASPLKQV